MGITCAKLPEMYVEGLEELVRMGRYASKSEAIRVAVRELLKRELWLAEEKQTELVRRRQSIAEAAERITLKS